MNACVTTECSLDDFRACKDPNELLDYSIDYSIIFNATDPPDGFVSSTWTVTPAGLTIENTAIDIPNKKVTAWVSGGLKLETRYKLVNHIGTVSGREFERTILIIIRNK